MIGFINEVLSFAFFCGVYLPFIGKLVCTTGIAILIYLISGKLEKIFTNFFADMFVTLVQHIFAVIAIITGTITSVAIIMVPVYFCASKLTEFLIKFIPIPHFVLGITSVILCLAVFYLIAHKISKVIEKQTKE